MAAATGAPPPPPPPAPSGAPASPGATSSSADDSVVHLNRREMRLGLRHRDSFAVHKAHLSHLHSAMGASGAPVDRTDAILQALEAQSSRRAPASPSSGAAAGGGLPDLLGGAAPPPPPPPALDSSRSDSSGKWTDGSGDSSARSSKAETEGSFDVDEDEDDGGLLTEGGPEAEGRGDGRIAVNPDSVADIARALATLDAGGGGAAASLSSPPPPAPPRKKNKLKSMAKGVGSFLGLRKSKKKRQAEEAAAAAAAAAPASSAAPGAPPPSAPGGGPGGTPDADSGSSRGLGRFFLRKSHSSGDLLGSRHSGGSGSSTLSPRSLAEAHASPLDLAVHEAASGEGSALEHHRPHYPLVDEEGSFLPAHRHAGPPRPILKGAPGSRSAPASERAASALAAPAAAAGGGGAALGSPTAAPASVSGAGDADAGRRGISFADQHGHDLRFVRFCDNLHYSEGAQHEEWDEEGEDVRGCSIM